MSFSGFMALIAASFIYSADWGLVDGFVLNGSAVSFGFRYEDVFLGSVSIVGIFRGIT